MDIDDFKDNFKYKLFVPFIYIVNWALMFVGPTFIQVQYQKLCICILSYLCIKSFIMVIIAVIAFFKSYRTLNKAERIKTQLPTVENQLQRQIFHAYIIPSYKEDIDLLSETLEEIAKHPWSKERTLIFLAMEAHEQRSQEKAQELIKKFERKFHLIAFTQHHIRQFEQKGKASNVSWCGQHLEQQFFKPRGINTDSVFITVIDADSWVPEIYIRQVEEHMIKQENYGRRHKFIYQPTQMFTRNHLEVPIITRTYDQLHSCMHFGNLLSAFDITYPLSNYTLSFNLIKKIGFWDTCADAIGQDFHTTMKAFWKTGGDVQTVPIFAFFNQVNIQTGKGYLADMQARFWQAERHARGCADVAYNINMFIRQPFNFRTFVVAYGVLQCFIMPAIVPWAIVAMTFQSKILFKYSKPLPQMISEDYTGIFFNFATFCFYSTYFLYYIVKRKATTVLYNLENESILRIIEYPILFIVNMVTISIPCFVIAAFGTLFEGRQYVVADKVMTKKNIEEH